MSEGRTGSPSITYAPGDGTGVVGPGVVALIDAPTNHPLVSQLAPVVARGAGLAELAGHLATSGLDALPPLVICCLEGGDGRLIIRGDLSAEIDGNDGGHQLDGRDVMTWREEAVTGVASLVVRLGTASSGVVANLPIVAGTVPASVLALTQADVATASPRGSESPPSPPAEAPPAEAPPAEAPPAEAPPAVVPPAIEAPPDPVPPALVVSDFAEESDPARESPDQDLNFAHLLGHTQHRAVEDAAVRAPEEPAAEPPAPAEVGKNVAPANSAGARGSEDTKLFADADETPSELPAGSPPARSTTPVVMPPPPVQSGGLIAAVPGMGAPSADAASTPVVAPITPPPPPAVPPPAPPPAPLPPPSTVPQADVAPVAVPAQSPAPPEPLASPPDVVPTPAARAGRPPPPPGRPPTIGDRPPPPAGPPRASTAPVDSRPPPPPRPSDAALPDSADRRPPPPRPSSDSTTLQPALGVTPSAPTARPDNDEVTLLRAPDDRVSSETPSPQSQPLVQAVHCPEGHPNPVHSDTCRRCAQAITDRAVSTVERPALGRIVFGSGTEVVLNRPVVIGRRPPPQVTVEGQRALPVAVKDSAKLLSRIHVEVRLVDWQVQIVDRDSMNHTFIEIPGSAPMQLRPAEPYPIPPGTTVNLADAARFTYLVSDD